MALQTEERAEVEVEVKRHVITLDEYDRMCEADVFDPDARIELIRGEIVDMPPPGPDHEYSVGTLNEIFVLSVGKSGFVWPQGNSIGIPSSNSRPEPDIAILRRREDRYRGKRPTAEDVILLVEVSYSTLMQDRTEKLALYAEAGIPQYWVVNLVDWVVEVYTDPAEGKYGSARVAQLGETIELTGGLRGSIAVDDVLGGKQK